MYLEEALDENITYTIIRERSEGDFITHHIIWKLRLECGIQTWNNAQARKQCLCKFIVFGVKFTNVPAFYIENAQKGFCKVKFAKFACVNDVQYSMSVEEHGCIAIDQQDS